MLLCRLHRLLRRLAVGAACCAALSSGAVVVTNSPARPLYVVLQGQDGPITVELTGIDQSLLLSLLQMHQAVIRNALMGFDDADFAGIFGDMLSDTLADRLENYVEVYLTEIRNRLRDMSPWFADDYWGDGFGAWAVDELAYLRDTRDAIQQLAANPAKWETSVSRGNIGISNLVELFRADNTANLQHISDGTDHLPRIDDTTLSIADLVGDIGIDIQQALAILSGGITVDTVVNLPQLDNLHARVDVDNWSDLIPVLWHRRLDLWRRAQTNQLDQLDKSVRRVDTDLLTLYAGATNYWSAMLPSPDTVLDATNTAAGLPTDYDSDVADATAQADTYIQGYEIEAPREQSLTDAERDPLELTAVSRVDHSGEILLSPEQLVVVAGRPVALPRMEWSPGEYPLYLAFVSDLGDMMRVVWGALLTLYLVRLYYYRYSQVRGMLLATMGGPNPNSVVVQGGVG